MDLYISFKVVGYPICRVPPAGLTVRLANGSAVAGVGGPARTRAL